LTKNPQQEITIRRRKEGPKIGEGEGAKLTELLDHGIKRQLESRTEEKAGKQEEGERGRFGPGGIRE